MRRERLLKIFADEDNDKQLVRDVCVCAAGEKSDVHYAKLVDDVNSPIDVFLEAYRGIHSEDDYAYLRTKALFKLIYMLDVRIGCTRKRTPRRKRFKAATLDDVVRYAAKNYDVKNYEKLLIFSLSGNGVCLCIYESRTANKANCSIYTDEFLSLVRRYRDRSFIIIHSHPLGKLAPSEDDASAFAEMRKILLLTGSKLIDSVVVSEQNGEVVYNCVVNGASYYKELPLREICI